MPLLPNPVNGTFLVHQSVFNSSSFSNFASIFSRLLPLFKCRLNSDKQPCVLMMDSLLINSRFDAFAFHLESLHSFSGFNFQNSNKLKSRSVLTYTNNPRNPNSNWGNYRSPLRKRPFSAFLPIIKKIKDIASKASKIKWASSFQGCSSLEALPCEFEGNFSQNGAIGIALLSVTSTAKVKISPFVATLAANPTFVSALFAWAIAQSIKVFLNFWVERKWDLRIMFASGGMPSSHSALCTALTTSVAICHGVADSLFPVCLWFSLIVMYDAIGVRRHAGMQAEVLNVIIQDLFQGHPISQRKLKELLGHTPSQVVAGALLGSIVAWICCQGCAIAV